MPQLEIPVTNLSQIIDTVFIAKSAAPSFMSRYGILIGPSFGALVAVGGWFASAILNRRNQLKASKENLLEKVRFELDKAHTDYDSWLRTIYLTISNFQEKEDSIPGVLTRKKFEEECVAIGKSLIDDKGFRIFEIFSVNNTIFPEKLKMMFEELDQKHDDVVKGVTLFIAAVVNDPSLSYGKIDGKVISEVINRIIYQNTLRINFHKLIVYECTKHLPGVRKLSFVNPPESDQ